jgi:hypothetical protein
MPAKVFVVSSVLVSTNASALGNTECDKVIIQGNSLASICFVGNLSNQTFALVSGATFTVSVSNISAVYAKTSAGSAVVNYIAMSQD